MEDYKTFLRLKYGTEGLNLLANRLRDAADNEMDCNGNKRLAALAVMASEILVGIQNDINEGRK